MASLAYQLYSSRQFPPLEETLGKLHKLGFRQVEGYSDLITSLAAAESLAEMLDRAGLSMPTCHVDLSLVQGQPDLVISMAQTLGVEQLYLPYLAPAQRPVGAQGWLALGIRLEEAIKPLAAAGLALGWHNHDFEFAPVTDQDQALDLLLASAQSLSLELDIAWAVRAGVEIPELLDRHGHRVSAVHVKDIAAPGQGLDEDGWADVGAGTVGWGSLIRDLDDRGIERLILEHDNPRDDMGFADRSLAFISAVLPSQP